MRNIPMLSLTAALCAVVLSAADAQHAVASNDLRPALEGSVASGASEMRPVAVYQIVAPRGSGIPSRVAISDSAGVLVAALFLPGATASRPMIVEFVNTDIVLQGETPSGAFTLVLHEYDAVPAGRVIGRWILGDQEGKLRAVR